MLEVGAVLPHYFTPKWDILDKFERGKEIVNEDVVNFTPKEKYDLIVSISTLEHVGFDDDIKEPKKILRAIENLKTNCLNNKGEMIITLPLGYNLVMDELLFSGKLGFNKEYFMGRITKDNCWKEITKENAKGARYGKPYNAANKLFIGIIKKN